MGRDPLHQCPYLDKAVFAIWDSATLRTGCLLRYSCNLGSDQVVKREVEIFGPGRGRLDDLGVDLLSVDARAPRFRPGLEGITRSTIRRRLHQEGFHFYEGQTWCESHDPEFESKKTKS